MLTGFGLGFFVALQLGPMSLLLIRSTLRSGFRTGWAVGAGIATVDALYASAGALGAAPLLLVHPVRLALGVVGTAVLLWLGLRTLWAAWHVRLGLEGDAAGTPWSAYRISVGATASNPLTILSWAALFGAVSSASPLLVVGVGLGSFSWVTVLALITAVLRRALGVQAVRCADTVAGLGLVAFGSVLGWRTLSDG